MYFSYKEHGKDINRTHFNEARRKKKISVCVLGAVDRDEIEAT